MVPFGREQLQPRRLRRIPFWQSRRDAATWRFFFAFRFYQPIAAMRRRHLPWHPPIITPRCGYRRVFLSLLLRTLSRDAAKQFANGKI